MFTDRRFVKDNEQTLFVHLKKFSPLDWTISGLSEDQASLECIFLLCVKFQLLLLRILRYGLALNHVCMTTCFNTPFIQCVVSTNKTFLLWLKKKIRKYATHSWNVHKNVLLTLSSCYPHTNVSVTSNL